MCGEHKFNKDNCVESYNCIYMNWYIEEFDAEIPFCFSYQELMNYYIKSPETYLQKHDIRNYNNINKSNFCDIIKANKKFLNI